MNRVGQRGEDAAARRYESMGFRILGRNVRVGHEELDIICSDGEHLCFAEVKTRTWNRGDDIPPAQAVDMAKRSHLLSAAQGWLDAHPDAAGYPRMDVCEVYLDRQGEVLSLRILENAFSVS